MEKVLVNEAVDSAIKLEILSTETIAIKIEHRSPIDDSTIRAIGYFNLEEAKLIRDCLDKIIEHGENL